MSQEPEDISRWVQDLLSRSAREQIQALHRLSNLVQRVTSGELDQAQVRDEYIRFFREESTRYVTDLTRLGLSFQNALLELNRKYTDRFFDQVMGSSSNDTPPSGAQTTQRQQITLAISGKSGEEIVRTFVIENKRSEEEVVTFLVSEFSDAQSTVAFRPPLQLQPARLHLRPAEEHTVTLHLPLIAELFQPGHTYFATIVAKGHSEVLLSLKVDILEPTADREDKISVQESTLSPAKKVIEVPREPSSEDDDFTHIKRISAVAVQRLKEAEVTSFAQLASLDSEKLRNILGNRVYERAKRENWQQQAQKLADDRS